MPDTDKGQLNKGWGITENVWTSARDVQFYKTSHKIVSRKQIIQDGQSVSIRVRGKTAGNDKINAQRPTTTAWQRDHAGC